MEAEKIYYESNGMKCFCYKSHLKSVRVMKEVVKELENFQNVF